MILQQTRVAQGLPYYQRFVETFPTVQALAEADEKEVMRLWQGLGYYSRARNLHETAKMVVCDFGGIFPTTYAQLLNLKGIGTYTAAAIASFAFDEKVAVLDGNVYRVLSRLFGIETDITSTQAKKVFGQLANELISEQMPALHNQAIMEFGAMQCVPVSPQCMFCPFAWDCEANATGRQAVLPVKLKKTKVRERYFHYFVIEYQDRIVMRERTDKDVWQGMYDFYLVESSAAETLEQLAAQQFINTLLQHGVLVRESAPYTHILSHQRIHTVFWQLRWNTEDLLVLPPELHAYTLAEVEELPKSTLVNNFLKEYIFWVILREKSIKFKYLPKYGTSYVHIINFPTSKHLTF